MASSCDEKHNSNSTYDTNIKLNNNFDDDFDFNQTCESVGINNDNYKCIYCKSTDIVEDISYGSMVCRNCGATTDDCIENSIELVQYNDDGQKSSNKSCSIINKLLPQASMVTTINGSCSNIAKSIHNWGSI